MTTTYRKTATIEATQWFKMGDHPAVVMKSNPNHYADEGIPWCPTMEGGHVVTPGDWIATGIKGEHWPIKPDVFAETYTSVDITLATPATEPQGYVEGLHPYTQEIGVAGDAYVNSVAFKGEHRLPAKFRWHELWDAMQTAARPAPQPAADTRATDAMILEIWGLAQQYDDFDPVFREKIRAIIGTATPSPIDKIAEAARVLLDAPFSVMAPAFDAMERLQGEGGDRVMSAALRALAGQGE